MLLGTAHGTRRVPHQFEQEECFESNNNALILTASHSNVRWHKDSHRSIISSIASKIQFTLVSFTHKQKKKQASKENWKLTGLNRYQIFLFELQLILLLQFLFFLQSSSLILCTFFFVAFI